MDTWDIREARSLVLERRHRRLVMLGLFLLLMTAWAGCTAAPPPTSGDKATGDHQAAATVATGSAQSTADFALAIEDSEASAAVQPELAILQTQRGDLYWTGDASGTELAAFGSDDEPPGSLFMLAARPLPDGRQTCNIRDDRPGPKAIWAACSGSNKDKVVRHFFRGASRAPAPHFGCGRATLLCGESDGNGGGYFHIKKGHMGDWEALAAYDQVNWRTAADWGMWNALKYPSKTEYQPSRGNWAYKGWVYLKNKDTGETVKRAEITVVVRAKTKNIVTAFPSGVRNF